MINHSAVIKILITFNLFIKHKEPKAKGEKVFPKAQIQY
jgi:hypothetical protein